MLLLCVCTQVWHHNTLGFDEFLGLATCDKSDVTPDTTAAVIYQLPLMSRDKRSSSAGGTTAGPEVCGRVTVEVTTRKKLDAL